MATEPSQPKTIAEFKAQIVAKAWQDENFKRELLSNPKAVLERETGQKSPAGFEVTAVEETPNHIYMVLPVKPSNIEDSEEFSDEALEAVAGGYPSVVYKGFIVPIDI